MVIMASSGGGKGALDFRMSKKVAELTQVVHMLFTRNHEKEVDLEAIKDAYEDEIDTILRDARGRIESMEHQTEQLERQKQIDADQIASFRSLNVDDLKKRLMSTEQQLAEEKKECQSARDLLILARNDIERLRDGQSEDSKRLRMDLEAKSRDVQHFKNVIQGLEKALRDKDSQLNARSNDSRLIHEKLQQEVSRLKDVVSTTERQRDDAVNKSAQLDGDVKSLRRELAKRVAMSANSRQDSNTPLPVAETNEDVDRLKKEILRYRMELSNRESNFNRMFKEKQPIHVQKGRQSRRLSASDGMPAMRIATKASFPLPPDAPSNLDCYEDAQVSEIPMSGVPTFTNKERLPNLSLDSALPSQHQQRKTLVKPKPLPKELLSAKSTGYA